MVIAKSYHSIGLQVEKWVAPMNEISAMTRQDIVDFLLTNEEPFHGRLSLTIFLQRIWDLKSMAASDARSKNALDEIQHHMIYNHDYSDYDLLYEMLSIISCSDHTFLRFLEQCIHPLVVPNKDEVNKRLQFFNDLLRKDGYKLKASSRIIGRSVYQAIRTPAGPETTIQALKTIEDISRNFHLAANVLRQRHNQRQPFAIHDEYDVQDLFHAMLIPFFADIRPEEVVPSYAGGHTRIDFLLKAENIVVEIKKTRANLTAREVGNQLIIDKDHYLNHPNCKTFIAFVYDPDRLIANPRGLERDLSRTERGLHMRVIVAPS
jgi:hypothetical protein